MVESSSPAWIRLDLESGVAAFLGLPDKLYLPLDSGAPAPDEPGFSIAMLGAGLERAVQENPDMGGHVDIRRFVSRWTKLADMERFLRIGNPTFAEQIAREQLRKDPGDPPSLTTLAHIALSQGRAEEARILYERVLERAPTHSQTLFEHALATAAAGNPGDAVNRLKPLTRHPRMHQVARLWRYEIKRGGDDLGQRIRSYRSVRPDDDDPDESAFDRLERAFPDNPEVAYATAVHPARPREDSERARLLGAVLVTAPDHIPARIALAATLGRMGNHDEACRIVDEGLALAPGNADLVVQSGLALEQTGRKPEARAAFRSVFENPLSQLSPQTLTVAASGMLRLASSDETRILLEDAVEARPGDPLPHMLLARLDEGELGREHAEKTLRKALKTCGPSPVLQYGLGDLLRRSDRRSEAEGTFRMLAERHRNAPWGFRGLGDLEVDTNPTAALENYERALALDPSTPIPGYDYLRGMLALGKGAFAEAAGAFQRAAAGEPDNPRYWSQLGAAHFYTGSPAAAVDATSQAHRLDPDNPGYLHNLAVYHRALFAHHPIQHAGSLIESWRYRFKSRRKGRGSGDGWEKSLWSGPDGKSG